MDEGRVNKAVKNWYSFELPSPRCLQFGVSGLCHVFSPRCGSGRPASRTSGWPSAATQTTQPDTIRTTNSIFGGVCFTTRRSPSAKSASTTSASPRWTSRWRWESSGTENFGLNLRCSALLLLSSPNRGVHHALAVASWLFAFSWDWSHGINQLR